MFPRAEYVERFGTKYVFVYIGTTMGELFLAVMMQRTGRQGKMKGETVVGDHQPTHQIVMDIEDINANGGFTHFAELFQPKLPYSATQVMFCFKRCRSHVESHNEKSLTFVPLEGFAPPDLVAFTHELESRLDTIELDHFVPIDDSVCESALLKTLGHAVKEQYRSSGMHVQKITVNLTTCCSVKE